MMTQVLLFLFVAMSGYTFAQNTLTVEIRNLRNNKGQIHIQLNDANEMQIVGVSKAITDKKCIFVFENLKTGNYAFKFIHDENNNQKLDANVLGIPKEGFNFSNNPTLMLGAPLFDKTIFMLNESKTITIKPKYFF